MSWRRCEDKEDAGDDAGGADDDDDDGLQLLDRAGQGCYAALAFVYGASVIGILRMVCARGPIALRARW